MPVADLEHKRAVRKQTAQPRSDFGVYPCDSSLKSLPQELGYMLTSVRLHIDDDDDDDVDDDCDAIR